jgi:hypothetical protein
LILGSCPVDVTPASDTETRFNKTYEKILHNIIYHGKGLERGGWNIYGWKGAAEGAVSCSPLLILN